MPFQKTNNSIRNFVLDKVNNLFTEDECYVINKNKVVENIERGIYNYTLEKKCIEYNIPKRWDDDRFKSMYLNKAASVYAILNSYTYKNKLLKARMLKGEIMPHEVVFINPQNIFMESKM